MSVTLEPLTMQEAATFWEDKVVLGPGQFAKLSHEAKIKAFAVSGIAKGDELATVFNSIERAIKEGIPFSQFKAECAAIFERRGWTGKRDWRVQNIFRTNIQTAYNSGRWARQKANAKALGYLQYSAVNDRRTRPTHRAMDGKVFRIDHPVWEQWYPPNGYRCRCSTLSLSEGQVKRMGLTVDTEDPTNTPIGIPDLKTGEKMHVQQLLPDPGFAHHPGKVVWGGIVDGEKRGMFKALDDLRGPADYRRTKLANVRPSAIADLDEAAMLSAEETDEFYKDEFLKLYGQETVLTDGAGEPVILSLRSFLADKTPGAKELWKFTKDGHGQTIPFLKEMIETPYEIWLTPQQDSETGRIRLSKRYVSLWKTADKKRIGGLAIFEVVDGIFQGVTAFAPRKKTGAINLNYVEKQRLGLLLYPRR